MRALFIFLASTYNVKIKTDKFSYVVQDEIVNTKFGFNIDKIFL